MNTTTPKSTPALNSVAARRLLANIERDLTSRLRKTKTDDPLESLLRRSRHVISVALMPSRPDGFPSTTPGNGNQGAGGGRFISVDDEQGQPDRVPITATEQAVGLVTGRTTEPDHIGAIAREVLAELATVQASLAAIDNALNRFDNLRQEGTEESRQCYVAQVMYRLPYDSKWEPEHRSTLGGCLSEEYPVSPFVYGFHQRQRRLPTKAEMLRYLERGVVMVSAS